MTAVETTALSCVDIRPEDNWRPLCPKIEPFGFRILTSVCRLHSMQAAWFPRLDREVESLPIKNVTRLESGRRPLLNIERHVYVVQQNFEIRDDWHFSSRAVLC